jgi:hypothetical protein
MVTTSESAPAKSGAPDSGASENAGAAPAIAVDDRRAELRAKRHQLAERLGQTTDPAQVVVLECCLSELQQEIDELDR